MSKKLLYISLFLLLSLNANAQKKFNFGTKFGVNFSGMHETNSVYTDLFGINFGFLAEQKISSKFYVQGEILYNRKGGQYEGFYNTYPVTYKTTLDYLDLSLQAKWMFIEELSLDLGLQVGQLFNSKGIIQNDFGLENEVELPEVNDFDFSLNAGITYAFQKQFSLQAKYSYGLTKIFKTSDYKNSTISLSIIFLFKERVSEEENENLIYE
ncbi:MAG: hypothetical protein BM564_05115 [Bacteroidetes bacterium MedPE-SWsnd-G2]|nr:MAG: hypothetical protein BM564_05115 [Bacteroidetes bacterium MedPE-SWsnd-G2]